MSYPKLHLSLETLQDLFCQQLRVELDSHVCVQSVEKPPVMTKEVVEAVKAHPEATTPHHSCEVWSCDPSQGPGKFGVGHWLYAQGSDSCFHTAEDPEETARVVAGRTASSAAEDQGHHGLAGA